MKIYLTLALAALLAAGVSVLALGEQQGTKGKPDEKKEAKIEDSKERRKKVKELMDKKLELSQKLLKALIVNDLEGAGKLAGDLMAVRKEAAWQLSIPKDKLEDYQFWSRDFTNSAEKIIKGAKGKNPEAAKLGYLELTHSCFNCHTYIRDFQDIHLDLSGRDLPIESDE